MIDKTFIIIRFYRWLVAVGLIFFVVSCLPNYPVKTNQTKEQIYIWQTGDSLEKIAAKFGDSVLAVRRRNHIYEPEDLYAGFRLVVIPQKTLKPQIKQKTKLSFIRPSAGSITSGYGKRGTRFHYGVDFGANRGKNIIAVEDGIIIQIGYKTGYGKSIEIQHRNNVRTIYAHLNQILVKKKDIVKKQQIIGIMGNTGRSTGTHLHFEVIVNGENINPLKVIR